MTRFDVIALDVWGHSSDDCPDPDQCRAKDRCGFEVNDQWRVGVLEVSDTEDQTLIRALHDAGYLTDQGAKIAEIGDYSDGAFLEVNDRESGEPLFTLQEID